MFTHSELAGIVVLIVVLMGLFCFKVWFVPFYDQVDLPSDEELSRALALFEPNEEQMPVAVKAVKEIEFIFDPNTISKDSLVLLGMTEAVVTRFMNYRSALGAFSSKEQVAKVYGMDSNLLAKLLPLMQLSSKKGALGYVSFSDTAQQQAQTTYRKKATYKPLELEKRPLNLNTAVEEDFEKVYGIGEVLAARVVKYRGLLGGFVSVSQLFEVYGLDSSEIDLENWELTADTSQVVRIQINTADVEVLAGHPYISWKEAKVLVSFRDQHGSYQSASDLEDVRILDPAKISQLAGYLNFD